MARQLLGLESAGLVELKPRRGAFVRRVGLTDIVEMFETMAEIEASCGRFACTRMTEHGERTLSATLEACDAAAKTGDIDRYYDVNRGFHAAIYAASGNAFLESQALALQARLDVRRPTRERIQHTQLRHVRSVSAV